MQSILTDQEERVSTPNGLSLLEPLWAQHSASANAADAMYAMLREAVVSGQLKPGDSLIEEQLARQFNVSRTPVREALMKLEAENLGTRIARRGLVVRQISEAEVLDVYTVRIELDSLSARLAARHAQPPERAQLRWINQQIVDAASKGDISTPAQLSATFHIAMAEASHNAFLLQLTRLIHQKLTAFASPTYAQPGRPVRAAGEHGAVVDAIEAGDADRAARLAREHIMREHEVRLSMMRDARQAATGHDEP
jgi:DNA-binding GntR family transcriptional regulator